jgi:hypothetical protein
MRAEVRERLPWVSWRQAGRGLFEIEGVPDAVLREFSRRRVEIEERAFELTGVAASKLSRDRLQGIALATRKAKEYVIDGARWRHEAVARAAEHGLGERELKRLLTSPPRAAGRSEAEVVRSATGRLSGPTGLTAQHNTFAQRHALAEIAGEFPQGASVPQLERVTGSYLEHNSVVPLGRVDHEHRFTTRDLIACEQAIVEGVERRAGERTGTVHPRLPDLVLAGVPIALSEEQLAAARALATDGQGVSVLQALAGTGKTRVLAALTRIYEEAHHQVIGVAPTGRAARELGDAAGIPTFTIHRLLSELEESGPLAPRTVLLFDEAGTAPTRPSAELFAHAERSRAKMIAVRLVAVASVRDLPFRPTRSPTSPPQPHLPEEMGRPHRSAATGFPSGSSRRPCSHRPWLTHRKGAQRPHHLSRQGLHSCRQDHLRARQFDLDGQPISPAAMLAIRSLGLIPRTG